MITPCISAYLIKKSYLERKKYRIEEFIHDAENKIINNFKEDSQIEEMSEDDYVELRTVGTGSISQCILVYHITRGELYAVKKPYGTDSEIPKLTDREIDNYMSLRHTFLPKFYGRVKNTNYIVIEYINGQTLENYKSYGTHI